MPFKRRTPASARSMLRVFQTVRGEAVDRGFLADLQFAQQKDLDLSIRIGALLAFDALLVTAGINPLTASPGAPLSLNAPTQPWEVAVITLGMGLLAAYIASIDAQARLVAQAGRLTVWGGIVTAIGCLWILAQKVFFSAP